jgi:hypothetical protein
MTHLRGERTMKRLTWIFSFALVALAITPSKSAAQAGTIGKTASRIHETHEANANPAWRDSLTCSQAPCVLPNVLLSPDPANTPVIVVNPENSQQFIAAVFDLNCFGDAAFGSADGGATWYFPGCSQFFDDTTPTLAYASNGIAYFAAAAYEPIEFNTTQDNGNTWSKTTVAAYPLFSQGSIVTPWLGIDNGQNSPSAQRIYIAATQIDHPGVQSQISVSHSSDGGNGWSLITVDKVQAKPLVDQYSRVAVGPDGTVYVAWQRCVMTSRHVNCAGTEASMLLSKSVDGGNTWSKPRVFARVRLVTDTCDCAFFGNVPHTTVGVANPPLLATDSTGTLYAVMYNWTGKQMKVQLISSKDQGETWSKPTAVAPPTETHDQFLPTVAVSSTGAVGVSWLDRRNDRRNILYQPFTAVSTDGGASFGKNYALASTLSDTYYNYTLGDYMGNVWSGQTLYTVWPDTRNAVMQNFVGGLRTK